MGKTSGVLADVYARIKLLLIRKIRIGVAERIAIAITFAVMIVVVLIVVLTRVQLEQQLKETAEKHLIVILQRESEALNQEFLRVKRLSLALSKTTTNSYSNFLVNNSFDMNAYKESLIPQVKDLIQVFENISGWILFNSEVIPGTHTVSYTYESGVFKREPEYDAVNDGFSGEPWWSEAIKRGEHWTKPYYWEPWDADIISYSVPVFYGDELIAVAGAEFFMKPFQERLRNIEVYDTGFVMLIDEGGEAIYLPKETDRKMLDTWFSTNQKNIQANSNGIDYLAETSLFDQTVIAWQRLDNGWILIAQPKPEEMFRAIDELYRLLSIIVIATIPLAILLGLLMSRTLTKRLRALINASEMMMRNLINPNRDMSLIMLPDGQHDDLALLNRAFNRLQLEIQESLTALGMSEAQYRSLVEYSEQIIFTLNLKGEFLTTNHALEAMAGYPKEALVGQHFTEIFQTQELKDFWSQQFKTVVILNQRVYTEAIIQTKEGKNRILSVTLLPIRQSSIKNLSKNPRDYASPNVKNKLDLVMVTANDLTDRIEAEREVQRLLSKDKAALTRLVSGIAHEMNTPLGNALVVMSYLEEANISDIDKQNALESLRRNIQRSVDLVTSFKALSADYQSEELTMVQLKPLIKTIVAEWVDKSDIEIECSELIQIATYPSALQQVLSAVVQNAYIHGPLPENLLAPKSADNLSEPFEFKVFIKVNEVHSGVYIHVEDNGQGMNDSIINHIFDPFYTTRRGNAHSGLGLSVAYVAATQVLKGKLEASSIPYPNSSHKTIISLYLPLI